MRVINAVAALSGVLALIMLAYAHHGLAADPHVGFVYIAAGAQLATAVAGIAIAGRSGRLNLIAGALMLGGATIFAGAIYLNAFHMGPPHGTAPVGGAIMIAGWLALAFAKPQ